MLTFACGTCGISALSISLPWLDEWFWLSLVALVLGSWYDYQQGELGRSLLRQLLAIAVGGLAAVALLAGLLLPIWFLYCAFCVILCLARGEGVPLRAAAMSWLVLFVGIALWRGYEAHSIPRRDYLMTRFLAGGPGQAHLSELSKAEPFPMQETVQKMITGSDREAWNASRLLEQRAYKHPLAEEQREQMKACFNRFPRASEGAAASRECLQALRQVVVS